MGLFDFIKRIKEKKEAEKILRQEVEAEISDEVIKMKKEKIKNEILAKERGEKTQSKGGEFLKKLGEEFKASNIGGNEQMDRLIGKRDTQKTDKISNIIGGTGTANTNKDLAGIMGYNHPIRKDGVQVIGKLNTEDKLKEYLKKKV